MPESVAQEMECIHSELVQMDQQIEKDKAVMQRKILIACDACEHSYGLLHRAVEEEVTNMPALLYRQEMIDIGLCFV